MSHPERQIKNSTQEVEILNEKIYCVSRAVGTLPFNVDSGESAIGEGSQDTLLGHRVIGLRTDVNQAIFRIMDKLESVMDIVDRLFVAIFDGLNEICQEELEAIGKQSPFSPLKYLRKTPMLTFDEGVQMLKDDGVKIDPYGVLNTETERKLGQLVFEKYGTEVYILHRNRLKFRPFTTMPWYDDPSYSCSFNMFIRGEEIVAGAQRVHDHTLLVLRAEACGVDTNTISGYIDAFRFGVPPHGGFEANLERMMMVFCGLDNVRKASMFPRDPLRLSP